MLIIFDCDGVLIDSEILATEVNHKLVTELGLDISRDELSERFSGLAEEEIYNQVAEELEKPVPADFAERGVQMLDDLMISSLRTVKGVEDMLPRLKDTIAICSNSSLSRLQRNLTQTNLLSYFEPNIYAAEGVGEGMMKPAPDVFLHAAMKLGADPAETIVIEDSAHGVQGAVTAGMKVIGFTGASHTFAGHAEQLMDAGALTTVYRMVELIPTINALKEWSGEL